MNLDLYNICDTSIKKEIFMTNRKKRDEERLNAYARKELNKAQQQEILCFSADSQLLQKNDKLRDDLVLRDRIENKKEEASDKLLDRIGIKQDAIDDLLVEITTLITEASISKDQALSAISALRKKNPKLANQLENSLSLKHQPKKSRTIIKKRL